jgi:molybdopterin synthase catalytic subunit
LVDVLSFIAATPGRASIVSEGIVVSVVEFCTRDDAVAVASRVVLAGVVAHPLDAPAIELLVDVAAAGACVSFVGRVRCHDAGRAVRQLTYTCHPGASAVAERISEEVRVASPGVRALAVSHRVGVLDIGEIAIVCAVSADHRGQAFEACRLLVERIKAELPIWKHQLFADGSQEWVGSA